MKLIKKFVKIVLIVLIVFSLVRYVPGNYSKIDFKKEETAEKKKEPSSGSSKNVNDKEKDVGEQDVTQQMTRDNASAVETSLFSGKWTVGTDIPMGRYVVTTLSGSGNFSVNPEVNLKVNEILTSSSDNFGVTSITCDLEQGDTIEISGLDDVKFTPATTTESTELTCGYWIVGLDIPDGDYIATTDTGQSGSFIVTAATGAFDAELKVDELLYGAGNDHDFGVEAVGVNLELGDTIAISGLNNVHFTPQ